MIRTTLYRRLPGALAAPIVATALLPAAAAAQAPSTGGAQAPEPVRPAPASGVVSVSGPLAVRVRAAALLGAVTRFRGSTSAGNARRAVVIQRLDDATARWVTIARTSVGRHGGFVARWRTDQTGRVRLRALLRPRAASPARVGASRRALMASPELAVSVYRPAMATWYGPGFFGNQTACGITLEPDTIGVAHRSLPCGTKVALFANGRTLTVEVIDRGPYAGAASWDLTQATAEALGMTGSQTVGAIPLPGAVTARR